MFRMTAFYIENFGCRATAADAAAMERQLLAAGHTRAAQRSAADVVVLNTCTVTAAADAEARAAIRLVRQANPAARIVVTGCYAQRAPEELAQVQGVSLVVGVSHQTQLAALLGEACVPGWPLASPAASAPLVSISASKPNPGPAWTPVPQIVTGDVLDVKAIAVGLVDGSEGDHTRPVLKIQDGCNNRCSYCILPFVRGRSRSLAAQDVVSEINRLCAAGRKEIVLSGINLGAWGRDLTPRMELLELLKRVLEQTPLERLRLSSIEPMDITQDLVDFMAMHPRMARHFHVPLQSGSDRILAAMHRWYRTEHYAMRIEMIRQRIPGAGIGADVLCGFPGETDADHAATVELAERLPFTYLHVFSFSARPGTEAARLIEKEGLPAVPQRTVRQRARALRAIAARKSGEFRASQQGQRLRVLTLHTRGADARGPWTQAISDNYLTVRLPGAHAANQWRMAESFL
jgi:threonylcarbamoyladenosine tRNA methylthiotransferase MtaB